MGDTRKSPSGKMSPVLLVRIKEKISESSSKNSAKLKAVTPLFLDLRNGGGRAAWNDAGLILADNFSIAWRVLDAQFWGVPQRRRRIFLVADFRGQCAGQVLFVRDGLSRSFEKSRESWKGITKTLAFSSSPASESSRRGAEDKNRAVVGGVIAIDNHPNDSRMTIGDPEKAQTLTSRMGTGGGNVPIILCMGTQQSNTPVDENLCPTITAAAGMSGNNQPVVVYTTNKASFFTNIAEGKAGTLLATDSKDPPPKGGQVISLDRAAFNQGKGAKYDMGITITVLPLQ